MSEMRTLLKPKGHLESSIPSMGRLKSKVVKTIPERIEGPTEYAVLYIFSSDNFDAIDCANAWAREHGMERARELTLGRAKIDGKELYVARCYSLAPHER